MKYFKTQRFVKLASQMLGSCSHFCPSSGKTVNFCLSSLFSRCFSTEKELKDKLKKVIDEKERFIKLDHEYNELIEWLKEAEKVHHSNNHEKTIDSVKKQQEYYLQVLKKKENEEREIRKELKSLIKM